MIVAIPASEVDHVPPASVEVKVVLPPIQIVWFPESVPAVGVAVTVTVLVAVASGHPLTSGTEYVIVAVPVLTPVTNPVEALMVATPASEVDHVPPETVDVNVVVEPIQISCVPERTPGSVGGKLLTVTVAVEFGTQAPYTVYV